MTKSFYEDVAAYLERQTYAVSSARVASGVGCSRRTAQNHIRRLRDEGKVERTPKWFDQFSYYWVYSWIKDDD